LIILSRTRVYDWIRITGAIFAGIAALAWIIERVTLSPNPISVIVTRASGQAQWVILLLAVIAVLSFFTNRKKRIGGASYN
jgi:hypothetical protein